MKIVVIILAGGVGSRFNASTPKQFYKFHDNTTVIEQTIMNFHGMQNILVSNTDIQDYVTIKGGNTRQDSSYNGVIASQKYNPDKVIIHDACRPFVSKKLIDNLIINCDHACVPILPINDLVTDKENYYTQQYIIQTPQIFDFQNILKAHQEAKKHKLQFRDESSMYRHFIDKNINYIDGDILNIKITYKQDWEYAQHIQHIHRSRL